MRHGETQWNKLGKIQGQIDIPLNDYGREIALETRLAYDKIGFHYDVVYCSPLSRAKETAQILTHNDKNIIEDSRLMEMSFGTYDGCIYPEILEGKNGLSDIRKCFVEPESYIPDQKGESFDAFLKRTMDFLNEMKQTYTKNETILAVCHGGTIRSFVQNIDPRPLNDFWNTKLKNLGHVVIEWDEKTPFTVTEFATYYYDVERG